MSAFAHLHVVSGYSLRYGAVPIVRDTGGLHDSVVDVRESAERATGIKFRDAAAPQISHAIRKAQAPVGAPAYRWEDWLRRT